jgi:threonine dehydrogenase-like Zn-dependent dehydrogenase
MRGAILYAPRDVRVEERDDPRIINPTDAVIRIAATCVCGSDLWPYPRHREFRPADPDGP